MSKYKYRIFKPFFLKFGVILCLLVYSIFSPPIDLGYVDIGPNHIPVAYAVLIFLVAPILIFRRVFILLFPKIYERIKNKLTLFNLIKKFF